MADNLQTLGLDATELISELTKVTTTFKNHNAVIDEVAIGYVEYNKKGQAVKATAEVILESGQKLDVVLKQVKGSWDAYVTGVNNATKAMKDAATQQQILAGAQPAKDLLRSAGIDTAGLKASLLDAFSGVQLNLAKLIGADPANTKIAQEIFEKLKQGVVEVETGIRGKIQAALIDVLRLSERINAEQAKGNKPAPVVGAQSLGAQQLGTLRGQLNSIYQPVPGATLSSVAAYQASISSLLALVERGKFSLQQFYALFNKVRQNPTTDFAGTDTQLATLQQGIQRVIASYQTMSGSAKQAGDSGTAAARGLFISFDQFVRILEVQVIHRFFGNLITSMQQSIGKAAELSLKIAEIQTISQGSGFNTDSLQSFIRQQSEAFARPQADIAEGLYQAFSNQVIRSAADVNTFNQALRLSQITSSSVADSVNGLSSIMQSYRLTTLEAERASNALFKAVELGRFRMGDLGNTIGRITPLSAQMGVSYQEVLGVVSHLTVQGLRLSEAETQVGAIMQSLLRPSTEMSRVLEEWGFSSGEAALRTLGLAGVMRRLNEVIASGRYNVGELTPNVRAIRGLAGTQDVDAVQAFIDQMNRAGPQADAAVGLVAQSVGHRWRREMEKITNQFTGFGDGVIKGIFRLAEPWGGVANAVQQLTVALREVVVTGLSFINLANQITSAFTELTGGNLGTLIKLWVDYKIAITTVTLAQAAWASVQSTYTALQVSAAAATTATTGSVIFDRLARYTSTAALTGQSTALAFNSLQAFNNFHATTRAAGAQALFGAAVRSVGPLLGALAWPVTIGIAVAALTGQLDPLIRRFTDLGKLMEQIEQVNQRISSAQTVFDAQARRDLAERERTFNETLTSTGRRGGEVFAELNRQASALVNSQRIIVSTTTENMRASLRGVSDAMRNTVSELERQITEARTGIQESVRHGLSFADRDSASTFQRTFNALGRRPEVVTPISRGEPRRLREEEARFAIEQQQNAQQQRLIQQRVATLQQQAQTLTEAGDQGSMQSARRKFEEIRQLTEQSFQLQSDFSRRTAENDVLTGRVSPENGILRYQVPLQQLQRQMEQLTAAENDAEQAHQRRLAAGERSTEARLSRERARQQRITDSIRQLSQLQVTNVEGNLLERFRGPQGLQRLNEDFNQIRQSFEQALNQGDFAPEVRFQALNALTAQYGALRQQVEREAANIANREEQNTFNQRIENTRRLREAAAGRQTDLQQTRSEFVNELGTSLATMTQHVEGAFRSIHNTSAGALRALSLLPGVEGEAAGRALQRVSSGQATYQATIEPLNTAREAFRAAQGTEREAAAFEVLRLAIRETDRAYRSLFGQAGANILTGTNITGHQAEQAETGILQGANALQTHYQAVANAGLQLQQAQAQSQGLTLQVAQAAQNLGLAAQGVNQFGGAAQQQAVPVQNFTERIRELANQLDRLRNAPPVPGVGAVPVQGFASGGLIGGGFNTFGPDNMLAAVRTGEFVINPDSTRRFYSQLVAINSGKAPSFASGGLVGSSVTNVGDISINVNDSGDPNATSRAVLGALRRELRRGNGRLN